MDQALGVTTNDSDPSTSDPDPKTLVHGAAQQLGITKGQTYDLALFHAERHRLDSTFASTQISRS
jgi:hypothetical protein